MATSDPPPGWLQVPVPCDGCKSGAPGKHYCTICRKTMCNNCEEIHSNLMKDHKVLPRSEIASTDQTVCSDHPKDNVSHYCIKCKRPICVECITDNHNGHKVMKLSVLVEEKKLKIQNSISDIDQKKLTNITKALDDLQANEDKYKRDVLNRRKEINNEADNIQAELDKIKAEVDKVRAKKLSLLSQTEQGDLGRFADLRQDLKGKEDTVKKNIEEKEEKIHRCHENPVSFLQFVEMKVVVPDNHTTMPLESSPKLQPLPTSSFNLSDMLKTLNLQIITSPASRSLKVIAPLVISSFKAEVKGYLSICTTSDGHGWIGGYQTRELVKMDVSGKILQRRRTRHRLYDLAMIASGDIIMSPNESEIKCVIRLGPDGSETTVFETAPFFSCGVSVTSNQQILVCTLNGRVTKCSKDGSNTQMIYNKSRLNAAVHAIELPDKTICISDWTSNGLVKIDKEGQQITTITQPLGRTNFKPWGLACDRMGNILSTDLNNDCIYIIDQNRQVKELVGSSHGIKQPRRVDIDKDDNLWIAQTDGTITVVRYLE